tara:strand:- start:215 stop:1123 length:909 start_codon:yes stop_codon:yes gene_type:complete
VLGKTLGKILDSSIYLSFDQTGYKRHEADFDVFSPKEKEGKVAVVTGGSSGIGLNVVNFLSNLNVDIYSLSRSGDQIENESNKFFLSLDVSNFKDILNFCEKAPDRIDYLVLNAGGMPEKKILNDLGFESQFASQVIGHYLMMKHLFELNKLHKETKVVWTTSGGMYLCKYDERFAKGEMEGYDKVKVYANAKRAQVILLDYLKKDFPFFVGAMHPGWVDTPGVRSAIPGFYEFTKNRLRNSSEGADTINWLLLNDKNLASGELWFDRKIRKKYLFPFTKTSKTIEDSIYQLCKKTYSDLTK